MLVTYYTTSMTINSNRNGLSYGSNIDGVGGRINVAGGDRALLDFNIADIPDGATVTSVKLLLHGQSPTGMSDDQFSVYPVNQDWTPGIPQTILEGSKVVDYVADDYQRDGVDRWIEFSGKDILKALQDPDNYGLMVVANGSETFNFDSSNNDDWMAPKLQIQYSMDSPTTDGGDSIDYCNTCHGKESATTGDPIPLIQETTGARDLKFQYDFHNSHGMQMSKGPGSRPGFNWGATLNDPYYYGMGPLQCTDCHDPHGSSNVYHLKESINGRTDLVVTDVDGNDSANVEQWCASCHNLPQQHEWWGTNCLGCHNHGRTNTQRF
jgi:hypothetical protein